MSPTSRWFEVLLRAFPAPFRREYGRDLLHALDDWLEDDGRRRWVPDLLTGSYFLLRSALQERLNPSLRQRPAPRGQTMERLLHEFRLTLRGLLQRPGFTAVALLTLALGVGANTAIFSIVNTVILKPLPYSDPEQLVTIRRLEAQSERGPMAMSQPDIEDIERSAGTLQSVAGYQRTSVTLTGDGGPEIVQAAEVTHGLLTVLGQPPIEGRDLVAADNTPNGERVVVVGKTFAETHLGQRTAVGAKLQLQGETFRVIGVAPENFDFPQGAKIWLPIFNDTEGCGRGCHFLQGIARLQPGEVSVAAAQQELDAVARRLKEAYPEDNTGKTFFVEGLQTTLLGDTQRGLLILLASVGLVLLIAAANLASLQLARSSTRSNEIAVRSALGASRARLCGLLLQETMLLGLGGGLLGLLLGLATARGIVALAPEGVPRIDEVGLDSTLLVYALAASLATAIVFAIGPSWRLTRPAHQGSLRSTADAGSVRTRNALLTAEVALSLLLLVGAGLLLQTYRQVLEVDLGFEADNVSSFLVALPEEPYAEPEQVAVFFERVEQELASIPGVTSVGGVLGLPFSGNSMGTSVEFLDEPEPEQGQERSTRLRVALPEYFETLGIRTLEGRNFDSADRQGNLPVAVVNQAFVERFCDGELPLDRQIQIGFGFGWDKEPRTIVGVVSDFKTESITAQTRPEVFVPQAQMGAPWMSLVVRSAGDTDWAALSTAVQRVDPMVPLRAKSSVTEAVDRERGPARFYFLLLAGFAAIAVALSLVGLYGVVSYLVSRRTREIAIRMAVGARATEVTRQFLVQGLRPVAAGLGLGLVAAVATSRFLSSLLFEVSPYDPSIYLAAAGGLTATTLFALLLPARRAGRVSPARMLQEE
ncbi:MAG: ABC transporter permease [Acidobacteriota bacterium]